MWSPPCVACAAVVPLTYWPDLRRPCLRPAMLFVPILRPQMMQHLHEMTEEQRREFLLQSKVAAGSIMHEVGTLRSAPDTPFLVLLTFFLLCCPPRLLQTSTPFSSWLLLLSLTAVVS